MRVVISTQLLVESGLAQVYASWLCGCSHAFCYFSYHGVCRLHVLSSWRYQVCSLLLAWLVKTGSVPLETFSETWYEMFVISLENTCLIAYPGIPGMLSVATDWAFEVCALLSGK